MPGRRQHSRSGARRTRTDEAALRDGTIFGVCALRAARTAKGGGGKAWPVTERRPRRARATDLPAQIAAAAEPLPSLDDESFGRAFDRFGDRRVVLLGEASHGTSEFYRARAAITRRLVEAHGFNIIAVEADFPDASRHPTAMLPHGGTSDGMRPFPPLSVLDVAQRPPLEWAVSVNWLREHNAHFPPDERLVLRTRPFNQHAGVEFRASSPILRRARTPRRRRLPGRALRASRALAARARPQPYGRGLLSLGTLRCEKGVVAPCRDLLERQLARERRDDGRAVRRRRKNARLVAFADALLSRHVARRPEAWNPARPAHVRDARAILGGRRGPRAKPSLWRTTPTSADAGTPRLGEAEGRDQSRPARRERFGKVGGAHRLRHPTGP